MPKRRRSPASRALGGPRLGSSLRIPRGKAQMRALRLDSLRGLEHHFRAGGLTPAADVVDYARRQRRKVRRSKTSGRVRHFYPKGI
jgi:hypothetical protein